ncbi:MAG: chromosomal replication initiator protein DnaA [Cytophagales bacterium]|nr:chromosomal replication initiator protein DnaA [Cytophagales bacterium]
MKKDFEAVWEKCLELIQAEINEQSFNTWFKPIEPVKLEGSTLFLQIPSKFFYDWLEEHYVDILANAIRSNLGVSGKLQYILPKTDNKAQSTGKLKIDNQTKEPAPTQNYSHAQQTRVQEKTIEDPFQTPSIKKTPNSRLNPRNVFDCFVVGDANQLAYTASAAVAERPGGTSFNPLMLYGGVGLGKTHLVQAIGNKVKEKYPEKFVLYVSCEEFTNQVIDALRRKVIQQIGRYYLGVDVLIIDDIQFFAGKEKTQEIFFHIFNHLHQLGKQIILTSDKPPSELEGLENRLLSRFKWGLVADLKMPSYETRKAIVLEKLAREGEYLNSELVEYLANNVTSNIRELEGAIISVVAKGALTDNPEQKMDLAKQSIQELVQKVEEVAEMDIDTIQKVVSEYFKVSIEDLKGKTRKRHIVVPRQTAMYIAKEFIQMPLKVIGSHFGGRDHSTVIHAVRAVNILLDTDTKFFKDMEELKKQLNV